MRDRVARDPVYAAVRICARWNSYEAFKADMGEQPAGKTLDRKNGSLLYSKATCKWSTPTEQANNTARNVVVSFAGKEQTLAQWAKELGLVYGTLHSRVNLYQWSIDRAFTEPHRGWNKQGRIA